VAGTVVPALLVVGGVVDAGGVGADAAVAVGPLGGAEEPAGAAGLEVAGVDDDVPLPVGAGVAGVPVAGTVAASSLTTGSASPASSGSSVAGRLPGTAVPRSVRGSAP
jgi:hypothetical protein